MRAILLIGACGSGKTWVMKQLIAHYSLTNAGKFGLIKFKTNGNISVLGKYTGDTFDGSDRLSMAVAKDFEKFNKLATDKGWTVVAEGDRFTNRKFIDTFAPTIIKILDDGLRGRTIRQSKQTQRHINAIATRVSNIKAHHEVNTSTEALTAIKTLLQ